MTMATATGQHMNQFLSAISPLLKVPSLSYAHTAHDLGRLRQHARVCDSIASALLQTSAQLKSIINASASPIFRLPNEILSEIMLWATDTAELTNFKPLKYERFGKHLSPIVLSQVCHQWRKVSHSDPRLWTFLWVDLTFQTSEREVKKVDHWFRMARELPVTVNITENDDTRLADEAYSEKLLPDWDPCRQVLKTLFSHSHKIGSLFFGIMDGGWGDLLKTPMNFPNLRHLTMNNELDPIFDPAELLIFSDTPQLQSLDLWAIDASTLRLPLGGVTSLRICWTRLEDLITILRLCPALQHLCIRGIDNSVRDISRGSIRRDVVNLPRLHTLEISDDLTDENLISLLHILVCPSLASFKYNSFGLRTYSHILIPHLTPFLEKSDKLVSLDASGIVFKRANLENLLRAVPTLHHLTLDLSDAWDSRDNSGTNLVRLFHRDNGPCDILPRLRSLKLDVDLQLSFDTLFSAFEARCPEPPPRSSPFYMTHEYHDYGNSHYGLTREPGRCRVRNDLTSGLESAWVNIHAPAGHVAPAEWKYWLDSLSRRGLPVYLNVPFAKAPIATLAPRTCSFGFSSVI